MDLWLENILREDENKEVAYESSEQTDCDNESVPG